MSKSYFLMAVLVLGVIVGGMLVAGGSVGAYIDIPSFFLVLFPALFLSLATYGFRGVGKAFACAFDEKAEDGDLQKAEQYFKGLGWYLLLGGLVALFTGIMALLINLGDPDAVGSGVATALTCSLYTLIFELILVFPFLQAIRKRYTTNS